MALPVTYGTNTLANYFEAGKRIAQDLEQNNGAFIPRKINNAFFEGGPLELKSFTAIFSARAPVSPTYIRMLEPPEVTIRKEKTWSKYVEYVEYIPILGSVVAVISILAHMVLSWFSEYELREAVRVLRLPNNETDRLGTETVRTDRVFDAAVDYTIHQNHMTLSAIAILPFFKIIFSIIQGLAYNPTQVAMFRATQEQRGSTN